MSIPGFLPSNILNNGQEDHAGKVQYAGSGSSAGTKTLWSDNRGSQTNEQGLNFEMGMGNANTTAQPQPNTQSYLDIADLTMAKDKYSVLLPTYNERRNLPIITFVSL